MALSARYPLKVVVRRHKRGLASAVVDGLRKISGQIVGVMDADLQHPPEVISSLLKRIEGGADIAIASRYVEGGGCQDCGWARKIISRGAIFLAHLLLPSTRGIRDPMSDFFMLRRGVVASAGLRPTGFKILLEILIEGEYGSVAEAPYTFRARSSGESKLSTGQRIVT